MCVSPVQPGQQALGSSNELHHGAQEVVGGLAGQALVVGGVLAALRHRSAQAVMRRPHLGYHRLQLVRLHARILLTQRGQGASEREIEEWVGQQRIPASKLVGKIFFFN